MTKRKGILDVDVDIRKIIGEIPAPRYNVATEGGILQKVLNDSITIPKALEVITRQMKVSGNRSRTINDYTSCKTFYNTNTNCLCI
ncbi:hypothetical protein [Evansella cellulosilytica]|uniref:hypothetical protein n=1 Tax=Evansella cellulosilytica TaxID=1413 RepID=UPI0001C28301|nr:hypothetical protein [Evansella cellulosilytica]